MQLIPRGARAPLAYWLVQGINGIATLFYLIFNWSIMGIQFVAADIAKPIMHVIYLPIAIFFLWEYFSTLSREDWTRNPRWGILAGIVGGFVVGAFLGFNGAIDPFEHPSENRASYPTDYWYGLSQARDNTDQKLIGEIAIFTYFDKERSMKEFATRLNAVRIGPDKRSIRYFWDVGPVGIIGHGLSALGSGLLGVLIIAILTLIWASPQLRQVARHTPGGDLPQPLARMVICLPAVVLCAMPFPALRLLSVKNVWAGSEDFGDPMLVLLTLVLVAVIIVLCLAFFGLKRFLVAKRLAALAGFVISAILPVFRLWSKDDYQYFVGNLFQTNPYAASFVIAIVFLFINLSCLWMIMQTDETDGVPKLT